MRRDPRLRVFGLLAILTICVSLSGCSDSPGHLGPGGGGGNPPPPPPADNATVEGVVVNAMNVAQAIPDAQVAVGSATQTTGADGTFTLRDLPVGTVMLNVTFPAGGAYHATQLAVPTVSKKVTRVTVAAVPSTVTMPDHVSISPKSAQIDVGGQVAFTVTVTALGLASQAKASLAVTGEIGEISTAGLFHATAEGTGQVVAYAGASSDAATVQVVPPMPPRLGTVSVSPGNLPAEGGQLRIAVTVTDGDGILDGGVVAHFDPVLVYPGGGQTENVPLSLETGTRLDGSWSAVVVVPANNNPIANGHQLPKTYSVQVVATDARHTSTTAQWMDFVVAGLEPPPPPPGGGS